MQAQLEALGIAPIRIPAVNGRDPVERARSSAAPYAQLSPGEIGCFESHRRIWQDMVDKGTPVACILEDDMLVAGDFATLDIPDAILNTVDLIKVDYDPTGQPLYGAERIPVTDMRSISRMLTTERSTGCYIVTLLGAGRLLAGTRNYMLPVDTMMFGIHSKLFWTLDVWRQRHLCGRACLFRRPCRTQGGLRLHLGRRHGLAGTAASARRTDLPAGRGKLRRSLAQPP